MTQNQMPVATPRQYKRRPRAVRRITRVALLTLLVVGLVGAAFAGYLLATSRTIRDSFVAVISRADTPDKSFPGRDGINLLILGRDFDRNNRDQVVDTHGRTDCIMLAHVDFRNQKMAILSIPRDTLVRIPGYRGKRKINAANALGGPDLVQETVQDLLDVTPDYFVMANFDAFEQAIDELGGVQVTVDKQMDYDDDWGQLHIHLKPGSQHLNGDQAMGFVRFRKSNEGGGDSDLIRIQRQQELVHALKTRLCSPGAMVRVPKVIDNVRGDIEGNLTTAQLVCLARFVKSLPRGDAITMETIPTLEGSRIYVRADLDAAKELARRMFTTPQP